MKDIWWRSLQRSSKRDYKLTVSSNQNADISQTIRNLAKRKKRTKAFGLVWMAPSRRDSRFSYIIRPIPTYGLKVMTCSSQQVMFWSPSARLDFVRTLDLAWSSPSPPKVRLCITESKRTCSTLRFQHQNAELIAKTAQLCVFSL